jgi:hypothetical protein
MSRCSPFEYNSETGLWRQVKKHDCSCHDAVCPCPPPQPCPCPDFTNTLISVRNPGTVLVIPEDPTLLAKALVGVSVDFTLWSDIITDVLNAFDNTTGTYTVPESGDYSVRLIVNYQASTAIAVSPTLDDVPSIIIYDVATTDPILASTLTAIVSIIPVPPPTTGDPPINVTVASLISKAVVTIDAVVSLVAGQQIRVCATTNGLTYTPPFELPPPPPASIDFSPTGLDTTLTIVKVRNTVV